MVIIQPCCTDVNGLLYTTKQEYRGEETVVADPQRPQRLARFQIYLRRRLQETGVSMRSLSLAMGRDPAYVAQLLDPPHGRPRALPPPDELKLAAPLLGVPLLELLDVAYGITRADLEDELVTMARHQNAWIDAMEGLTVAQREQVLTFAAFVKAHGRIGEANSRRETE